ncbi:MAG: MFS family permease, partial [Glaciecola sp.]
MTETTSPMGATFAPLREPTYRRMWLAMLVSNLGTFLQMTAAPWIMLEMTGSPLQVSLVTAMLTLPRLLFTLPSGALADAFDRRTLMILGHLLSAAAAGVMAVMTAAGHLTPNALLILSFVLGSGGTLSMPSFQTLVPDLVSAPLRAQAITLNSAAFNLARALGPSLGGALVAVGLASMSFGGNAVSYLVVIGVLLTIPREVVEDSGRPAMWRSTALGLRYVRFTRPLRVLILVTALFVVTGTSLQALLPSVAADDLGLGA